MKFSELKSLEVAKLQELLAESRQKLQDLRFGVANNQVKQVRQLREVRSKIAQILTLIKQRQTK
ncbi:MAG: 50S ribosomal protein L29 [Candidatus Komeilibacteria bacterium]